MLNSQGFHLLIVELLRQESQDTCRTPLALLIALQLRLLDGITEETHLAVEVVTLAPADEILNLRLPLVTVCHIEHTSLQIADYVGTEAQILIDPVLRQTGEFRILILQYLGEMKSLLAFHQARSHTEIIDVRFQRISEFLIIGSIDGNVLANVSFGDGTEVDSGNRTVGQHTLEIPDAFMDGGRSIPVETDGDTLGDTLGCTSLKKVVT